MNRKPNFIIIGAAKSGTTALKTYLRNHPDIWMPEHEIHYWNSLYKTKPVSWYYQIFKNKTEKVVGEKTPNYIFEDGVAERIHDAMPDVKLIVLLRNPVLRAYSEYKMWRREGIEHSKTFKECVEKNTLQFRRYLRKSLYADDIERWKKVFSENQILWIKTEDLYHHRDETLKKVYDFLGVEYVDVPTPDVFVGRDINSQWLAALTGTLTLLQWRIGAHAPKLARAIWACKDALVRLNEGEPYKKITDEEYVLMLRHVVEDIYRVEKLLGWDCSDWFPTVKTCKYAKSLP